jgi:LysM repeat protein
MAGRNPVRYLAPIALVGLSLGVYLIVHHNVSVHPGVTSASHASGGARGPVRHVPRFYTVHPGDVMTAIADKTGVPLTRIEALNPNVFPNSLQTGQKLRLRR